MPSTVPGIQRIAAKSSRAVLAASCALGVTGCVALLGDFDASLPSDSGVPGTGVTSRGDGSTAGGECTDGASCGNLSAGDAASGAPPDGSTNMTSTHTSPDGASTQGAPDGDDGARGASDGGDAAACASTCAGCCNGATCEQGTANDACGTGGAACVPCSSPNVCSSGSCGICPGLIDNTTSDTPQILTACGRTGEWFTYGDSAGVEAPPPGPSDGGADPFLKAAVPSGGPASYAVHFYGSGFATDLGVGTTLGGPPDFKNVSYDATSYGYAGISFYVMRGTSVASASATVAVQITDEDSDPAGGLCNNSSNPPAGTGCYDSARYLLTVPSTWTQVTIPFTSFAKSGTGYGGSTVLDATAVYVIEFQVSGQSSSAPFSEDIWVANLSFTP